MDDDNGDDDDNGEDDDDCFYYYFRKFSRRSLLPLSHEAVTSQLKSPAAVRLTHIFV